jgi:hypothetical protein
MTASFLKKRQCKGATTAFSASDVGSQGSSQVSGVG